MSDADFGTDNAELETGEVFEQAGEQQTPAPSLADFDLEAILQDPRVKKAIDDTAAATRAATQRKVTRKVKQQQQAQPPAEANPEQYADMFAQILERLDRYESTQVESSLQQAWKERGYPADSFEIAKKLHGVDAPSDLGSWLDKLPSSLTSTGQPQTPQAKTPAEKRPAVPTPGSTPTASQRDYLSGSPIDPLSLSSEDISHLRASGQYLQVLERWRNRNNPPLHRGKRPDK